MSDQIIIKADQFWSNLEKHWSDIYNTLINTKQHNYILELINRFLGDLIQDVDVELTVNEINRSDFKDANGIVELYLSPRLNINKVHIIDNLYRLRRNLPNLHISKYRAYNIKDSLIADIEYENVKFTYTDFGCQWFQGLNEEKQLQINIIIFVKREAASKLLTNKEITVIMNDKTEQKIMKWLPTKLNVVDILLVNIIGEYNLIHKTGYIEFLPEGDPLISNHSVFTELNDLREAYNMLYKNEMLTNGKKLICACCDRRWYQSDLLICSKCKNTYYCCKTCQKIHYPQHKLYCV